MANEYVPGVCNINIAEIKSRRTAGHIGLALTLVIGVVLIALDANRYARFILFIPIFIAAIGYLQARNKFCVGYGSAGMQRTDEQSHEATTVTDASAVTADKARARNLNLQAFTIAIVVTALALAL